MINLPETELLAQLAEEASELSQAALKLRRALDGKNPTPKTAEMCRAQLLEEVADTLLVLTVLGVPGTRGDAAAIDRIQHEKYARWEERLAGKERCDGNG